MTQMSMRLIVSMYFANLLRVEIFCFPTLHLKTSQKNQFCLIAVKLPSVLHNKTFVA